MLSPLSFFEINSAHMLGHDHYLKLEQTKRTF